MRQVVLRRGEDGYWIAEVPSLPGVISQGKSRDEALRNVEEAAELWIETMKGLGQAIPDDNMSAEVVPLPKLSA